MSTSWNCEDNSNRKISERSMQGKALFTGKILLFGKLEGRQGSA